MDGWKPYGVWVVHGVHGVHGILEKLHIEPHHRGWYSAVSTYGAMNTYGAVRTFQKYRGHVDTVDNPRPA